MCRELNTLVSLAGIMAFSLMTAGPATSNQEHGEEIVRVLGTYKKIHSRVLNEERTVLVSLPEDYHRSRKGYPVLYVLDAESTDWYLRAVAARIAP